MDAFAPFSSFASHLTATTVAVFLIKATAILVVAELVCRLLRRSGAAVRHQLATAALASLLVLPLLSWALPSWELEVLPGRDLPARGARTVRIISSDDVASSGVGSAATKASLSTRRNAPPVTAMERVRQPAVAPRRDETSGLSSGFPGRPPARSVTMGATASGFQRANHAARGLPSDQAAGLVASPADASRSSVGRWGLVTWLWFAGAAWGLVGLGAGAWRMWRVAARARTWPEGETLVEAAASQLGITPPELRLSDEVAVPMVWGPRRPMLLLPAAAPSWSQQRLQVVLLHELAHVARHDGLWLVSNGLTRALYWFHPLVWRLEQSARHACELACDQRVVASGVRASDYATHLLALANPRVARHELAAALAMARPTRLEERLLSLLGSTQPGPLPSRRACWLGSALLLVALLPLASARLAASPSAEPRGSAASLALPLEVVAASPVAKARPVAAASAATAVEPEVMPVLAAESSLVAVAGSAATADVASDASDCCRVAADLPVVMASRGDEDDGEVVFRERRRSREERVERVERSDRERRSGERWYDRAMEHHNDDEYQEAIEAFVKARELDYRPATAAYNIACGHSLLGDVDEALSWLERAYFAEDFGRTDLLWRDSDLDPIRADPRFRKLLERVTDELEGGHRRGRRLDRLDDAKDALADLEAEGVTDGEVWYQVGTQLLQVRQLQPAARALAKAAELLGDESANAYYNLACTLAIDGKVDAAFAALGQAVDAGFDSPDHMAEDADLRRLRSDARWQAVLERAEDYSLEPYQSYGGNRFSARRWGPAVSHFAGLAAAEPKNGRAHFSLGYARHYAREHAAAADSFSRAAALGYKVATSRYNIACAYAMLDDKDRAFAELEAALDAGYRGGHLWDDSDLDNLRDDERFEVLLDRVERDHRRGWKQGWRHEMRDQIRNWARSWDFDWDDDRWEDEDN